MLKKRGGISKGVKKKSRVLGAVYCVKHNFVEFPGVK